MVDNRIIEFWNKIAGSEKEFTLEERIFHSICIIAIIVFSLVIPLNIINNLPELSVLMSILLLIGIYLYYLSRWKKNQYLSIMLFSLLSNILFAVNFYYNSGIEGPSLIIFLVCLLLTIVIVPKKQYYFWLTLNISEVLILLFISNIYPGFFENAYPSIFSRHADFAYSYVFSAIMVFMTTVIIRNRYHYEKSIAEKRAAELQISNETKDKLFSILAHDLRSPLGSIQNYLEILSESELDETEKITIWGKLLNQTNNTQEMLSNLLFWSKRQMDGISVSFSEINLKESVFTVIRSHLNLASAKGIDLKVSLDDSVMILGDKDIFQLVIRNLVNNAVKFTSKGGKIEITSSVNGNQCIISISDNGIGIPYELQPDLFTFKVKSSYGTNNEKGVGIGLALCKEFTEMQNGKIWFESEPGKGSTFYIGMQLAQ